MKPAGTESQNRSNHVFISPTFRYMMRERDLPVKRVFPKLRRKCANCFVTFTEVDLRWEAWFGSVSALNPESMR